MPPPNPPLFPFSIPASNLPATILDPPDLYPFNSIFLSLRRNPARLENSISIIASHHHRKDHQFNTQTTSKTPPAAA
uniref:Uncharacterized protein n=1 Tax=Solanum lycopersicum TaxID=4081 RepID=A0A3Q7IHR6_SOLLC